MYVVQLESVYLSLQLLKLPEMLLLQSVSFNGWHCFLVQCQEGTEGGTKGSKGGDCEIHFVIYDTMKVFFFCRRESSY